MTTLPLPVAGDAEDVTLALETAQELWKNLDYEEAVRWVRRAAEAAEDSGDDLRGVRLASAAADIITELSATQMTPRAPVVSPPPPSVLSTPLPPPSMPPVRSEKAPTRTSKPPVPPSKRTMSGQPPPPPSATRLSSAPPSTRTSKPPLPTGVPVSSRPPSLSISSFPPPSEASGSSSVGGRTDGLRAFRVYVQRSAEGALTVKTLRDGDKLPAGAREAILVFT